MISRASALQGPARIRPGKRSNPASKLMIRGIFSRCMIAMSMASKRLTDPFCGRHLLAPRCSLDLRELLVVQDDLQTLTYAMSMLDSSL
jgi:hypothetical protein